MNVRATPPLPVDGIDMRSLPIGPQEAFVLSRVDGVSSEAAIAAATGLDVDSVNSCLSKLQELGAITYPGQRQQGSGQHPKLEPPAPATTHVTYDPTELDEEVDLSMERKHQILSAFYSLEDMTHYELLNVPNDAEKKEIKAAYFKVVNVFHPDRYFGKNLGSFKTKLEQVFARMTEAEQVLTRKATREEYDAYLATRQRTSQLDALLANDSVQDEVRLAQARIEQEAASVEPPPEAAPPRRAERFRPSQDKLRRLSDPELRRKALARKLRGTNNPPPRVSGTMPAVNPPPLNKAALREKVGTDLKQRYQARRDSALNSQLQHYINAADTAEQANDPVSAVNALKIAVGLDPTNQPLLKRLEHLQLKATQNLADSYLEQAKYEEREQRLERAAINYERAALGKDSAALYDRAANCLLEARSNPKHAGDLARKAVEREPENPSYRITLARIYASAKMLNSAVKEAERAVKLAPDNESAKTWLMRIQRGDF